MTRHTTNGGLRFLAALGALALGAAACGSTGTPETETPASATEKEVPEKGLAGSTKLTGGEQLIPKVAKRDISADDRADFEKVLAKYQKARKENKVDDQCDSLADAFGKLADSSPSLAEARFNQGAVLMECGREDEAARIWGNMSKYGPAITSLGYIAWRKGNTSQAESMFNKAVELDPLHSIEARNNLAQLLRDRARQASPEGKKGYIKDAVQHLRTVLALDSNNLQAFATLAFIYYDMNMLEMAKLVGNQAIKKGEEIATGKFDEERTEEGKASAEKAKKGKKAKKAAESDDGTVAEANVQGEGTGYTRDMKESLALVYNTLGLVELKRRKISPAISQFRKAVEMNPKFAEARLNLAALSLNNRDYKTAEENFRQVLQLQPKNYEAAIGLGVALRGNKKIEEAEAQYNAAQKLDPANPSSYFNLGLLYQDYKGGEKPMLQKAQDYYRQFLSKANSTTPDSTRKDAEKRIKDIDEIYVALEEAKKLQAEAEEMQRKAEEQQKKMEEDMKKMEAAEKAEAEKAAAAGKGAPPAAGAGTQPPPAGGGAPPPPAGGEKAAPGGAAAPAGAKAAPGGAAAPAAGAAGGAAPAAAEGGAGADEAAADEGKGKKKKKKK
jgi:tetratricopeptide (TPR) repeat protein